MNGPRVVTREGKVAVVWYTEAGDEARVLAAVSENGGEAFGEPARLDGGRPLGRVDAAFLDDGSLAATWLEDAGEGGAEVRVRVLSTEGAGEAPVVIATVPSTRASGVPRIASLGASSLVAWTEPGPAPRVRVAVVDR